MVQLRSSILNYLPDFYKAIKIFLGDLIGYDSNEIKCIQLVPDLIKAVDNFLRILNWSWFN